MASGDQPMDQPKGTDMEVEGISKEPKATPSVEPQDLPGYLPWEQDLEMMSKFLDRKVSLTHPIYTLLGQNYFFLSLHRKN
jgi:hypothetical protein